MISMGFRQLTGFILDPLGMADTRITLSAKQRARMAAGHGADGSRFRECDPAETREYRPKHPRLRIFPVGLSNQRSTSEIQPPHTEPKHNRPNNQPGRQRHACSAMQQPRAAEEYQACQNE
jgi:CubicO group peptidase (beta-lactamase class C family)